MIGRASQRSQPPNERPGATTGLTPLALTSDGEDNSSMEKETVKRLVAMLFALALMGAMAGAAFAGASDTITVNYEVTAINEINIDGASVTLTVSSATAGSNPDQASDSTTYDLTTNCAANAKKITGVLNTAMPAGLTLQANMTAPSGATSAGATTLTASAADLVTLIDAGASSNVALAFTLDATAAAGVVASASKTCTLTIADS
jgi:hypothetical protein